MPRQPNRTLRIVVPILLVVGVAAVGLLVLLGPKKGQPPAQPPATNPTAAQTPSRAPSQPAATPPNPATPAQPEQAQAASTQPATTPASPAVPAAGYRVRVAPRSELVQLGSLDPAAAKLRLEITPDGAGVREIRLAEHFDTIRRLPDEHTLAQSEHRVTREGGADDVVTPFAALAVAIGPPGSAPNFVNLYSAGDGAVWKRTTDGPASFETIVEDTAGQPVIRITRHFDLIPGSYRFIIRQKLENLSAVPLSVRLYQTGPVDLKQDAASYGGDKRRVRFGYVLPPTLDPSQAYVVSDGFKLFRAEVLGKREALRRPDGSWMTDINGSAVMGFVDRPLWPNDESREKQYTLAWVATTNRYFGVAAMRAAEGPGSRALPWVDTVSRVVLDAGAAQETIALRLEGKPVTLAPAGSAEATADASLAVYAGPLSRSVIDADAPQKEVSLSGMVLYNLGGPCAFCTFQWLAKLLIALLDFLHGSIFRDWGLAIIGLVLIVRTLLHPVTRWSQIRMARWSKQMQSVAPKQRQIMEKFREDPLRLRQELARLNEEEGVSHAGALGCLPGFLQTPIWWALSASLYFAVELRHQPAFYGLFQKVQPAASPFWNFLGDLSEPDRFWYFGHTVFTAPLLGPIESLNVLPLILGVLFFMQQKYMAPPQAPGSMTPEQEFQMKLTKGMMIFMFPLLMYNAPSGLALYFLANSTIALLEGRYVRAHMEKHGMLDVEKMKAERKAKRAARGAKGQPGFFSRLQQRMEQLQAEAAAQQRRPK